MENNTDIKKIEQSMGEILAKGITKSFIVLKFGSTELMFEGGLREFADFIEKAGFEKLKRIKSSQGKFCTFDGDNKNLSQHYNQELEYLEDSADLSYDMQMKTSKLYSEEDALRYEALLHEYQTYGDKSDKKPVE